MSRFDFRKLKYAVYPRRCDICGDVVPMSDRVCDGSTANIIIPDDACPTCGVQKSDCKCHKAHHKPEYKMIVAPFRYDGTLPKAVHRLKFYSRTDLAYTMGHHIARTVAKRYKDVSFDCVTFVPLSRRRAILRGYNQSALLAKQVAKELGIKCKPLLRKTFNNPPQRTLPAKLRRGNVFGVFDIRPSADVEDKTILIIDDVKTTGATISACSYVLKIYGAKEVYAAAFAIR